MPFVYILFSKDLNKFYVGACSNSIEERIHKHNSGFYGDKKFTSKVSDWTLFFSFQVSDFKLAIRIEHKIKSMKSKVYIQNLAKYPEMVQNLIIQNQGF